ncbi:uncharacterized protein METZ01_LOCUS204501 [marine metagenome]|uniref:Uncharacterized protein n=1 Tax=marine metagenome TaxID=408172 RepID=A0A382EP60_9ZZZZ
MVGDGIRENCQQLPMSYLSFTEDIIYMLLNVSVQNAACLKVISP